MSPFLWRVILAVVCVGLFNLLLAPFLRVIGLPVSADVLLIVRICIAGLALLYVLKGPPFPPTA